MDNNLKLDDYLRNVPFKTNRKLKVLTLIGKHFDVNKT